MKTFGILPSIGIMIGLLLSSCNGDTTSSGTVAVNPSAGSPTASSVAAGATASSVPVPVEPVRAEFGYVASGMDFSFDAADSSPDATYAWDFGDGTTGSGIRTGHRYADQADYAVKLTVAKAGVVTHRVIKVSAPMVRSGFESGTMDFASVCTTTAPNLATPASLADEQVASDQTTGESAIKVKWFQTAYRGDRVTKGSEFCTPSLTRKEAWVGFMLYVPDGGYPVDKDAGVFQMFANKGCTSWTGMLSIRNNDLRFEHRPACVAPTATVLKAALPRNTWIPIVMHLVVSRQKAGTVRIWVGDDLQESRPTYSATNVNVGFGNWVGDALADDSWVYFKFGQYNYDPDNDADGETRTVLYDNISIIERGRQDGFDAVRPKGASFGHSGEAFASVADGVYGRLAEHAFDGDAETRFQSRGPTGWLQYRFADRLPTRIASYRLSSPAGLTARIPRDWRLLGSGDGRSWVELDRRTMQPASAVPRTYAISNPASYVYYRLQIDSNNGDTTAMHVGELSLNR